MTAINNVVRLARAGTVIAWSGARVFPDDVALPPPLQLFGRMARFQPRTGTSRTTGIRTT